GAHPSDGPHSDRAGSEGEEEAPAAAQGARATIGEARERRDPRGHEGIRARAVRPGRDERAIEGGKGGSGEGGGSNHRRGEGHQPARQVGGNDVIRSPPPGRVYRVGRRDSRNHSRYVSIRRACSSGARRRQVSPSADPSGAPHRTSTQSFGS